MKYTFILISIIDTAVFTIALLAPKTNAAVIQFTPSSGNIVSQSTTLYWDMLSSVTSISDLSAVGGFNLSDHGDFHFSSPANMVKIDATTGGETIPVGQFVGASSNFGSNFGFAGTTDFGGVMVPGDRKYFGLSFEISGQTHYGWVEISEDISTQTIHSWAYESTPNTSIQVGAIPEPSALLLLGLGGLCIVGCRSRIK